MATKLQQALNRRKTPYEIERDNYEKAMSLHIQKAINKEEGPTKEKHIRTILMGTYKDESARLFWSIALKLPLQGHPIVCWKFLHVLHKILREGHHRSLAESEAHIVFLGEVSKLWGHLKDGYGRPIQAFARLIVAKLKFHKKNPEVPGTMSLTPEVMASLTQNSIDNYFELSVDLLDYLDELLVLQNVVFASLDKSKANSMTLHGQCKLSPLIQCLQDSAGLYDALVKILFRLHSSLPTDTLTGHKERFLKSFRELKVFYDTCYNLQYYKNLVSVPQLPDNPPNFLVSSDLSHHRAPVVATVAGAGAASPDDGRDDEDEDDKEDPSNWVPELAGMQQPTQHQPVSSPPPQQQPVASGAALLDFGGSNSAAAADALFGPSFHVESETDRLHRDYKNQIAGLNRKIQELQAALEQATAAKLRAEERLSEMEKRVKLLESKGDFEERYTKLKTMYQQLREEHINLLKQNAASKKETSGLKQSLDEAKRSLAEQKNQLAHLQDLHDMSAGGGGGSNGSDSQQAELNDLRRRREELEASMTAASTEKSSLSAELEARQAEVDRLAQENFAFTESVRQLEERSRGQELELAAVGERLAEATGAAEAAAAERDRLAAVERAFGDARRALVEKACLSGVEKISETLEHFDDPALMSCRTSAEFLLGRIDSLLAEVESLESNGSAFLDDETAGLNDFVASIHGFTARACEAILQGRIVSNAAPTADLVQAARGLDLFIELQSMSRVTAEEGSNFLRALSQGFDQEALVGHCASLFSHLNGLRSLTELLVPQVKDIRPEDMGDLVETEMLGISEAVEAAEAKFRELIEKSADTGLSGVHLEVNMRVFESCSNLMLAVKALVHKSKVLQREIVAEGRGAASQTEFYKKHSRWTEGLISAAKAVGFGANQLCGAADLLVSSGGTKFEELIVCSQDIAASTAQLVVASRVKANPKSFSLQQLQTASKGVSEATGQVVAQAKSAAEAIEDRDALDFSALSITQTKRMEMNSQVRLLELEAELEKERAKLGELRRRHYRLADESAEVEAQPPSSSS
ncbi:hypothetical protein BOX15_Mlig002007g4 [Macrostomum lignano]|uniref:I/LWEQ domain-containing protein n=1 Tax=Macrostomum lignano TaxID=282301 RepID=A0A267DL11_9PLAT|nr:hypothetical protein BOX15_Mlig002007g4 [Macrostomum lignano]